MDETAQQDGLLRIYLDLSNQKEYLLSHMTNFSTMAELGYINELLNDYLCMLVYIVLAPDYHEEFHGFDETSLTDALDEFIPHEDLYQLEIPVSDYIMGYFCKYLNPFDSARVWDLKVSVVDKQVLTVLVSFHVDYIPF